MTARLRPSPTPAAVSGVHLSEGREGWTLSLSLTPDLLALIIDAFRTGEAVGPATGAACRMHVEPNLVPGEPFDIDTITIARVPDSFPSTAVRPTSVSGRDR